MITLEYRNLYHQMSVQQKAEWISKLTPKSVKHLRYHTNLMLRDKQIVPDDWKGRYYVVLAGRGWGKTKMGAYWIKQKVYQQTKNSKAKLAIVGPNAKDVERVMVQAILDEFPPEHRPTYVGGDKSIIKCHNGVIIECFTAGTEIRGGNYKAVWCDEMAKWSDSLPDKAQESFEILNYACRKGAAQFLITTTPKPWNIFYRWEERAIAGDANVCLIGGSMDENQFLSQSAKDELYGEYGGSRSGKQELEGFLLRDVEGALWNWDNLKANRRPSNSLITDCNMPLFETTKAGAPLEWFIKIVVAIDPAGSTHASSDETGIIVAGLSNKGHAYLLSDASGRYKPEQWAKKAIELYKLYRANSIIAEKNYGGDMVEHTLKMIDPYLPIKVITASRGKAVRANPISVRYEKNMVHHVGDEHRFNALEKQMVTFTGDGKRHDDRVDALVWALDELMVQAGYVGRTIINLPNFG